jgi:glucose/arabinose dehydrogenase
MKRLLHAIVLLWVWCSEPIEIQIAAQQRTAAQSQEVSARPAADRPPNAPHQTPAFPAQTDAPDHVTNVAFDVGTVATGLERPWALAFLPDDRMLVTERPGRLRVVSADGQLSPPVAGLPPVATPQQQGGLLGLTLDPMFASNQLVYWWYGESQDGGTNHTAVARGRLVDGDAPRLEGVQVIFRQEPAMESTLHFGCRLVWARDGTLFVTLGERSITAGRMAQQLNSLLGKIVRINADGSIPVDNPFVGRADARPEIWSIGHRNIQAAALHPTTGELWVVEHGTRGGDELNIARKGLDYGWPTIAYGIEYSGAPITGGITQKAGMEQPIYYWDPNIAPSGMAFYTASLFPQWNGNLFIGDMGRGHLVRLTIAGERVIGKERFDMNDRVRDVVQGPEGAIYILTDDPAGRILKLVPK